MQWLNEPASWQRTGDVLRVSVDPGTDFWRTTGYGYVHDNGHIYGELLPGDLDVSVRVRGAFANQYDQAGIMLRADEQTWLKTGLEFFEGRPRLSTVLTMGCSSWMVADLPPGTDEVTLRVSRRGDAVEVRYAAGEGAAELAALVFMPPGREMLAGIVCAAPEGGGFSVAFHDLRIAGREWGGQEAADDAEWAAGSAPATGWARDEAAATGAGWDGGGESWRPGRGGPVAGRPRWAPDWAGWDGARLGRGQAPARRHPAGAGTSPVRRRPAGPKRSPACWRSAGPGRRPMTGRPGWAGDEPGDAGTQPGQGERPGCPQAGGGKLAQNGAVDWAKPQANEPSEDWDRLSLSVSGTGSWNAFAAASRPSRSRSRRKRRKKRRRSRPRTAAAGRGGDDGAGEPPGSPARRQGRARPRHGRPAAGRRQAERAERARAEQGQAARPRPIGPAGPHRRGR